MSDYESWQRRRNITVGIFVITGLAAFVWMVVSFGDLPVRLSKLNSFQVAVRFPSAPGVQKDTPVRFCGYRIGRVIDVIPPERLEDLSTGQVYHQTQVILAIDNRYPNIPDNVEVKLMQRGLGSSYIELFVDHVAAVEGFLENGTLVQGSTSSASEFFPAETQEKVDQLIERITKFIQNANAVVGDKANQDNFKSALSNLASATRQADKTLKEIESFSAAATEAIKNADVKVDKTAASIAEASGQLNRTAREFGLILAKINNGSGTASRLLNDAKLYEELIEDAEQMQQLFRELNLFLAEAREKGLPLKMK